MAPFEFTRVLSHPYAKGGSAAHKHFAPTPFKHLPYSANCVPFAWMAADRAVKHCEALGLAYREDLEASVRDDMGFGTNWVQCYENQLTLLDTFFSAVTPNASLAFFYAKDTPLAEDPRRVIVGVGRVTHVAPHVEYSYTKQGSHRAVLWDRVVQHSIRPKFKDGFLFPYHQVIEEAKLNPALDLSACAAFAPQEAWDQFSFTSEHVTHDVAVASLIACAEALRRTAEVLPGEWGQHQAWIDGELNRLWKLRGPFPGLGSALRAFGLEGGNLVAYDLALAQQSSGGEWREDPWTLVDAAMADPALLGEGVRRYLTADFRKMWKILKPERRALLQLLSRFSLSSEQATRFYQPDERKAAGVEATDQELLANPYLLFELDRASLEPVPVTVVDRGMFPDAVVAERFPVPVPSAAEGPVDQRRSRALVVDSLEQAASEGHTLQPRDSVVLRVRRMDVAPPCPLGPDALSVAEASFVDQVRTVEIASGQDAYQLVRLADVGERIRGTVNKRKGAARLSALINWRAVIDRSLPSGTNGDAEEERARTEKAAALEELFASRITVLTGPAGTGKTTLLKGLCELDEVKRHGILLLAPTGKARVRMETQIKVGGAQTVAQYLLRHGRYVAETGHYRLAPGRSPDPQKHGTVIVDEASMLTEDQLGALIDTLTPPSRLILVGDQRQLPPIGAGRPFADIVRALTPGDIETRFPRVAPCFIELTVQRRHVGVRRDDLQLAAWFTGRDPGPGADDIWDALASGSTTGHVKLVRWDNEGDLQSRLLEELSGVLRLSGPDDEEAFAQSIGGDPYNGVSYFWPAPKGPQGLGAASRVEDWQILSPVRGTEAGVEAINRRVQAQFRKRARAWAEPDQPWNRKTAKPFGRAGILYGDKVISLVNKRRKENNVYPAEFAGKKALCYVANGEIGVVVGKYHGKSAKGSLPKMIEVEYASQLGFKYTYWSSEAKDEGDQILDLAYALTVHKTQGSEFGTTLLVLPNPCRLLSPELIYTALTRQVDRIIVLHQGDIADLKKYSRTYFSETARRLTNLLEPPAPVAIDDRFLERGLVHRTRRGEAVRSKSEVVIADLLHSLRVDYVYEQELRGADGTRRWPDFTIDDPETGKLVYWEHLGMLADQVYAERWARKLAWYRSLGVLPLEEGGASAGTLVTTSDSERGAIDSGEIERLVRKVFGL